MKAEAVVATMLLAPLAPAALAVVYEVGPGRPHASVSDVPWERLEAGDHVRIHARPEPYREKWVMARAGTADRPIVVSGVPDADGRRPVIDGRDARTRAELDYWGEDRGVIKIGGANRPANVAPAHIVVENLEIRGARPPHAFTGRGGRTPYRPNASAIHVEQGNHVVIRDCVLHDCGNGLTVSHASGDIVVERCHVFGNGIPGSIYEHNVYTECRGIVFQFNRLGPLRDGCPGNNLKDRSAGTVVRCNWIEGGNRLLDLVESDYADIRADARYARTLVAGNILVKLDDTRNNQVCHYGGDGDDPAIYRSGSLVMLNNTVLGRRPGAVVLVRADRAAASCELRNNLFVAAAPGARCRPFTGRAAVEMSGNQFDASPGESPAR